MLRNLSWRRCRFEKDVVLNMAYGQARIGFTFGRRTSHPSIFTSFRFKVWRMRDDLISGLLPNLGPPITKFIRDAKLIATTFDG